MKFIIVSFSDSELLSCFCLLFTYQAPGSGNKPCRWTGSCPSHCCTAHEHCSWWNASGLARRKQRGALGWLQWRPPGCLLTQLPVPRVKQRSFVTNRSRGIKVLLMVSLGMCKNRYGTSAVYNMEKGVVKLRIMSHALIWFKWHHSPNSGSTTIFHQLKIWFHILKHFLTYVTNSTVDYYFL